jgi:HAMP domain-containing protein
MKLRREARIGIGAIMVLQFALSMMTIALLSRMGPAIERILQENVRTEEAVEQMLAELSHAHTARAVPQEFSHALERASNNITEEEEKPLLEIIARKHILAFSGDAAAREEVIEALRDLGEVNRRSMSRADNRAKRLGQTGAWAAALLGAIALGLCVVIYQQLRLRIELPIEELRRTTHSLRQGNLQARCPKSDAPAEIKQISRDIDWLLDHSLRASAHEAPRERGESDLRRLLVYLLDAREEPIVVLDATGRRVASNRAALDMATPERGNARDAKTWSSVSLEGTDFELWVKDLDANEARDEES